jgi:hypothetical protein
MIPNMSPMISPTRAINTAAPSASREITLNLSENPMIAPINPNNGPSRLTMLMIKAHVAVLFPIEFVVGGAQGESIRGITVGAAIEAA